MIEILKVDVHKFTINKKDSEASNISVLNLSPNSLILDTLLTLNKGPEVPELDPNQLYWNIYIIRCDRYMLYYLVIYGVYLG